MTMNNFSHYSQNADQLSRQYDELEPDRVHKAWIHHLPATKALILDVGAGSGRDARWLANMGHEVVAVEPSEGMLEIAKRNTQSPSVQWVSDPLPSLKDTYALGLKYDLILLSAVWMHVAPGERQRAFRKLVNLLRPGGKLVISLRQGPSPDGRSFHPISAHELRDLANGHVLELLQENSSPDQMGREGVSWETLVFRLPDDRTGALPLLRHVIINDAKSSTYKLALLRILVRIADGSQGAVLERDEQFVTLPFGLVALYWVKAFKPLILDAGFLQQPSANGGLGFVKEGFRGIRDLSVYDLKMGFSFTGEMADNLLLALKDARDTIQKMPAFYTTYPNSDRQVFPCEKHRVSKLSSFRLDTDFLSSFGTFKVPRVLWDAMSQYACWIEPAIIREWCALMKAYDVKAGKGRPLEDYLQHLAWFDPERDTREVRKIVETLRSKGQPIYCIWTGDRLKNAFDVDHCFPFASWPNNDLWNLMPAHPRVNNRKSGKLPSAEILEKSEERLFDWWDNAYAGDFYYDRFVTEAKSALPIKKISGRKGQNEAIYFGIQNQRLRLKIHQQLQEWWG